MAETPTGAAVDVEQLETRIKELEHERKHLLAIVEILQEISGTLHFVDVLQGIARKLGESFGLDRCSILLVERGMSMARLVASYEDPTIRNYLIDLERYPELRRALRSNETVYIPDVQADPELKHVKGMLANRKVRSITVVPIAWRGTAIGAIFLRTFRDGPPFSESDVRFTQVVASLAAKALRNAYRYERLLKRGGPETDDVRQEDLRRVALIGFLRRLFDAVGREEGGWVDGQLSQTSGEELDRLVEIAMTVMREEAKGA